MIGTVTNVPRLRLATSSDEAAIATLLTAAHLPLEGVHEALPGVVVGEDGGHIVGVAGVEACGSRGEYALLRSVAVDAAWRS